MIWVARVGSFSQPRRVKIARDRAMSLDVAELGLCSDGFHVSPDADMSRLENEYYRNDSKECHNLYTTPTWFDPVQLNLQVCCRFP